MTRTTERTGMLLLIVLGCVAVGTSVAQNKPNPPAVVCANGKCTALPTDLQHPTADDPCLPISMPGADTLLTANRKVFAHYFDIFPLSMDNKPTASDYYSLQWLVANKGNMWYSVGGFLRTRPIGVPPVVPASEYKIHNLEIEVRTAMLRGITGFTYDIGNVSEIVSGGNLDNMLKAVAAVDQRFKIVLMVDHLSPNDVMTIVKATYNNPVVYRVDNKVVVAPYMANTLSPTDWATIKTTLANQGMPIYFLPTFLSLPSDIIASYAPVADAFGLFGTPQVAEGNSEEGNAARVQAAGKNYMSGISPQGYRPKVFKFWEVQGSLAYRNGWMADVKTMPAWIQLTTWNDLSETTQVSPYTDLQGSSGSGYYNLSGFYSSWYITGKEPVITHDVLYYFYRKQPVNASAPNAAQATVSALTYLPTSDQIELLGFLTAPGTLTITIGGKTYKSDVAAGVQSFTAPLAAGVPSFSLVRNGTVQVSMTGDDSIASSSGLGSGFADLTYWTGSASASGSCSLNGALK